MKFTLIFSCLFLTNLYSQTNRVAFLFEDQSLPVEVQTKIIEDLSRALAPMLDEPDFLVPTKSPSAPPNCIGRLSVASAIYYPKILSHKVEFAIRDPEGKESLLLTQEVSDIYTNRFAEIIADPIPFTELTALADRLQRVGSEPLSEEEFERHVIVPKSIMPVNPSGASFSAMSSNRIFYTPSILSIRKVEGEDLEELQQMFRDEDLPELTPDSLPVYEAFIVSQSQRKMRIARPHPCFFFNGLWHIVP